MADALLVDTDVMVDFLRGQKKAVALIQKHAARVVLSSLVVAELYAGVKGSEELTRLDVLVSVLRVVPVTPAIARAGGLFKNTYGKSHGVGLADAIIAATAEAEKAELLTLNTKHYPMLKALKPAYTKN